MASRHLSSEWARGQHCVLHECCRGWQSNPLGMRRYQLQYVSSLALLSLLHSFPPRLCLHYLFPLLLILLVNCPTNTTTQLNTCERSGGDYAITTVYDGFPDYLATGDTQGFLLTTLYSFIFYFTFSSFHLFIFFIF